MPLKPGIATSKRLRKNKRVKKTEEITQMPTRNALSALLQRAILESTNYAQLANKLSIAVQTAKNTTGKRSTNLNAKNSRRRIRSESRMFICTFLLN